MIIFIATRRENLICVSIDETSGVTVLDGLLWGFGCSFRARPQKSFFQSRTALEIDKRKVGSKFYGA